MIERLKNPGTIITITSAVLLICSNIGFDIDNQNIMSNIKAICTIGIMIGVLNNPTTPGIDLPFYRNDN